MSVVRLAATAIVALRGFVSERSLVASLALVVVSLGIGVALADASLDHEGRFEADLAWAFAEALGWFLALTQGAGLAGYRGVLGSFALARPVPANLLLAGRFIGLAAGLFLYAAAVGAILLAWLSGWSGAVWVPVLGMGWLLWLRLLVVLAVATFLLALARPSVAAPLAAAACIASWFFGGLSPAPSPLALRPLSVLATFVLPDFPALDAPLGGLPDAIAAVSALLAGPTLYAALYAAAMVAAATAIFPRGARRLSARAP